MKLKKICLIITLFFATTISAKALGDWIGDYCESCGEYGAAGLCDKVHNTNVGLFRVTFYLNGEKLGSSVNVSSSTTYQENALAAKWHWGDGLTDIVSYAKGTSLVPKSGGLNSIVISGIATSNVQTVLDPSKNSGNVQKVLEQAGITEFSFKNGKIYYKPPDGECDGDYEIQMVVEAMQIINWLCNSTGTASHTWIGTPYELNNGLLAQGYNSHVGGNGYMSGSVVDKTLLSALRIDENVTIGAITFSAVTDCLTMHIRGYEATKGYGFNVYNLTGKFEIDCDDKKCCIPCDPKDTECIKTAGDNYHEDDPYCCYEDEIATGFDEDGNPICDDADKYWEDKQDIFEEICLNKCVPPSDTPEACCDDCPPGGTITVNGKKMTCEAYIKKYCEEPNDCPIPNIEPEIIIDYCDDENDENISYFRDGVFNSENGQFKEYTIEKMENEINENGGYLPQDWITKIATEYADNTFLALAYLNDSRYTTKINDYCNIHCQEVFEVTLPDNYPFVNAGRYFKWTIKDSENDIAKAAGAKLCAVDIDLDKAIDNYQQYSLEAENAAAPLANMNCNNRWGVKPVVDGQFENCNDYASTYRENCAPNYVCLKPIIVGKCCCGGWATTIDADGNESKTCKKDCDLYGCAKALTGDTAKYWYTYTGGVYYEPACGDPGERFHIAEIQRCNKNLELYRANVEGYSDKTEDIYNQINHCKQYGEILLNMELELEYETLFEEHTYTTPDDIEKDMAEEITGANWACIDNEGECNVEDVFTMSERAEIDNISCVVPQTLWIPEENKDYKGICGPGYVNPVDPNIDLDNFYKSQNVTMLNVSEFSRCSGFVEKGPKFDFSLSKSWNTIYASYISNSILYRLNKEINACVCKDGEIKDLEDGVCSCTRTVDYDKFLEDYNNYQVLPDGTLTVEFMNGSGLYPISLKYWTIGSVDENGDGHFDSWLEEYSDGACIKEGDKIKCLYGDPFDVCRYVIKNRIIANPDDNCVGDDCEPDNCPEGNCTDPDPDLGDCIVDGKPVDECGNVAGLNLIYRVVDLDNPFPGIDGTGRTLPSYSNWFGNETIITNNRGVNGSELYTSNLTPLYSATLTPALIKEIRKDNETLQPDYLAGSLVYPNGSSVKGGGYSLFVHESGFITSNIENMGFDASTPWEKQFYNILNTSSQVRG